MCGGVGAQYTPAAGWAQAIAHKAEVLGEKADVIAVVSRRRCELQRTGDFGRR